ncbi:adenylate/guanylate cyclase domain-containing protein [Actinoplanes sp. TFC3]|uniref:adenylate/guanylate cyclase domain-containing protein n=1 Tax=Actinoplanes sp. TFC3 TaxID=1710355 RepID=UPI0008320451|nr:adenylate/guanylate cyclase domain-containing protein [Actinoplanes sp. TFC3]
MSAPSTEVACRRQTVTIFFVDIVGFTTLVDELDCVEVHELQRDYFATVSAVIREAGGIVEKFIGDAVMAVFGTTGPDAGTPREVGLAAAAAARAGLLVQEALRGRLLAGRHLIKTRVGLATGDAMVDVSAARDGGYGMVAGSVVATASRLQAYAPHDTVVVCSATQEASASSVAYQELPPVVVHGKRAPVELFRALQPQDSSIEGRTLQPCG